MTDFTLHVRNLRVLRELRWSPRATSVLIGANGAGKTSVLLVMKLLRTALERGLPEAVSTVLGGSHGLKHWDAHDDEVVEIGLNVGELEWRVQLTPRGPTVDYLTAETLCSGDEEIYHRDSLGNFVHRGQRLEADERLALRTLSDAQCGEPAVDEVVAFIRRLYVFRDIDLWALRNMGSRTTQDRYLHSRGANAITMLRRWFQERPNRFRYQFVLEGLRAAFPGLIADMDFVEAGQTLTAQVYPPGRESPTPLGQEANGVLTMIVLLCALADAEEGGVVAIDEPEVALHPYAIRSFARRAAAWAQKRRLSIILATHSTLLLDTFAATPEQVYILRPNEWPGPVRLDQFKNPEWLANFRLGELHADGELGSNDDGE